MTAVGTPLVWGLFAVVVAVALAIDLGVFHREARPMRMRDAAIWVAQSVAVPDAVSRGEGCVECVVLAHQYMHLAPLVSLA